MPLPFIVIGVLGTITAGAIGAYATNKLLSSKNDKIANTISDIFDIFNSEYENIILSHGETEAGKSTIAYLLQGKEFNQHRKKQTIKTDSIEIDILDKKYIYYDVNGSSVSNEEKEILRDELEKVKDKVIAIYVFNAEEYIKNQIKAKISAFKEELKKHRNFKDIRAIGTRADKIPDKQKDIIESEIRQLGVECKIFDMTKNPIEELAKFILEGDK